MQRIRIFTQPSKCVGYLAVLAIASVTVWLSFDSSNVIKQYLRRPSQLPLKRFDKEPDISDFGNLIQHANLIQSLGAIPMIAMVNKAYLGMTNSWLCNTANMSGVHERTIILASDEETLGQLKEAWPKIRVFRVTVGQNLDGKLNWQTIGYGTYLVHRIKILQKILEQNISMVLFETDAFWFKNPLPLVESFRSSQADIVGATFGPTQNALHPDISVNFLYLKSTERTKKVWSEMVNLTSATKSGQYEQVVLTRLCKQGFAKAVCMAFPYEYIADGSSIAQRNHQLLVLNNNFIVGVDKKVERAKKLGYWFLRDGYQNMTNSNTCEAVAVVKALNSAETENISANVMAKRLRN